MKYYRINVQCDVNGCQGFEWFRTKREAVHRVAELRKEGYDKHEIKATIITIIATKGGILAALQKYADHPDNG